MEQLRTAPTSTKASAPATVGGAFMIVSGGISYQVVGPGDIAAQIPVTTTTEAPPETTTAPAAPDEPSAPRDNSGVVAILGVAVFIAAVVTILIKGKKPAVK